MSLKNAVDKPRRTAWSLAARLTAWYAGSAFLLIMAATGFLYWALINNLEREDEEFLGDKVRFLRQLLREHPQDLAVWSASQYAQFFVRILDQNNTPIVETPGMSDLLPVHVYPPPVDTEAAPGHGVEVEATGGRSFLILAARATGPPSAGGERIIQVALDRTFEEELLGGYRRNIWMILGTSILICAVAGYHIARRGLRPVQEMAETARRIRSTTLHERLELGGLPKELSVLASTFNEMLDRLQDSFNRLSRFSADIAHELRTPVNNLRGEAEVALGKPRAPEEYREILSSSLEECGRLSRMIDSLLFLARAESPQVQIARERVDVSTELAAVREFYDEAANEAGIRLTALCQAGVCAELDRILFQRAVGNLVANALAHTPAGGTIQLSAKKNGSTVRIEVTDTGCGIPREHLTHVFDRFYRVDAARSTHSGGVGLGLAIVQSIANLHRGSAEIDSEVGRGTRVTLVLPADTPTGNSGTMSAQESASKPK
jgi:two-component system heavy metal sensor histidine kinase CusS